MTRRGEETTLAETKIACSLDPEDQEKRFEEFADFASTTLLAATRTRRGACLELRRSETTQASLRRLIEAERRCCSFLEFGVETGDDAIRVDVSGPPAARPLIDRLFDLDPIAGRPGM